MMAAQTVSQSHAVIAVIDRLIGEQEATFKNRMWIAEIHLRQSIIDHLKKYKESEYKFLDSFNEEGIAP